MYLNLTEGVDRPERRRVLSQSIVTALTIAVGFIFLGKAVFALMGITVADFKIAGGLLLVAIATLDIVSGRKAASNPGTSGAVPLGTPLIVGPATLTAALMLVDQYGLVPTLAAVVVNIMLAWAILLGADFFERIMGRAGSRAVSKVAGLILAAYAVMMIRSGVVETMHNIAGH